jgi:hypothetical protein
VNTALRLFRPELPPLPAPRKRLPPRRHGPGFACVAWDGTLYTFSPLQGAVVRILWKAWRRGVPAVRQEYLLDAVGSDGNHLRSIFRDHPAWGALIAPGEAKGTFQLNDNHQETNHEPD